MTKIPPIAPLNDATLHAALERKISQKTKPLGSLGRLEQLAIQVGQVQVSTTPALHQPQLLVFAADHGLAQEGISAYPSEVTWQMVDNFLQGGAAVSVLARQHSLALSVVDAGVNHGFIAQPGLINQKIALGTQNSLYGPAMSLVQCQQAVQAGFEVVRTLPGNVVLLGEMGIGNTSSAALLLMQLTGQPVEQCAGRGTGLDDAAFSHKKNVLIQVLKRHAEAGAEPWLAMAAVGGFELAMLAGAALQAASERRLVVVDGFIACVALLWAARLAPQVLSYCVWAHLSAEAGHALVLNELGASPLLSLDLRLGEASAAALVWPLIDSAVRLLNDMASFESATVAQRLV
jgi:nicotinate-nucleotide--dimethylbenzimidazole phosphoribosyltransferase